MKSISIFLTGILSSQRPTPTRTFQTPSTPFAIRFSDFCRQALVSSHDVHFIGFNFTAQLDRLFLSTTP
jgi:hypothetical protein